MQWQGKENRKKRFQKRWSSILVSLSVVDGKTVCDRYWFVLSPATKLKVFFRFSFWTLFCYSFSSIYWSYIFEQMSLKVQFSLLCSKCSTIKFWNPYVMRLLWESSHVFHVSLCPSAQSSQSEILWRRSVKGHLALQNAWNSVSHFQGEIYFLSDDKTTWLVSAILRSWFIELGVSLRVICRQ